MWWACSDTDPIVHDSLCCRHGTKSQKLFWGTIFMRSLRHHHCPIVSGGTIFMCSLRHHHCPIVSIVISNGRPYRNKTNKVMHQQDCSLPWWLSTHLITKRTWYRYVHSIIYLFSIMWKTFIHKTHLYRVIMSKTLVIKTWYYVMWSSMHSSIRKVTSFRRWVI